jgi:hypothetical protein
LFLRKSPDRKPPDYYLVTISGNQHGRFDPHMDAWKSEAVVPIAVSRFREGCEALLLMKPGDWVRTVLGLWQLKTAAVRKSATLALLAE